MVLCGPNLPTSKVLFSLLHIEISTLGIERQNTNQCSSGIRMEDQGVQSP